LLNVSGSISIKVQETDQFIENINDYMKVKELISAGTKYNLIVTEKDDIINSVFSQSRSMMLIHLLTQKAV